MRHFGRTMALLLVLPVVCCALFATVAAVKVQPAVEFHLLKATGPQDANTAGFDIAPHKLELESAAHLDKMAGTLAAIPEAFAKEDISQADASEDAMHDGPRPKMRKWFLAVLLVGGLVRYLTSSAYRRFVSEVLDPLNW